MERHEGAYLLCDTILFLNVSLILKEELSEKLVFQNLKDLGLKFCFVLIRCLILGQSTFLEFLIPYL